MQKSIYTQYTKLDNYNNPCIHVPDDADDFFLANMLNYMMTLSDRDVFIYSKDAIKTLLLEEQGDGKNGHVYIYRGKNSSAPYVSPKNEIRSGKVIIINDGMVLMVKDKTYPVMTLPGGCVQSTDDGDRCFITLYAAVRELREELDLRFYVEPMKLVARTRKTITKYGIKGVVDECDFYACKIKPRVWKSGRIVIENNNEIDYAEWVPLPKKTPDEWKGCSAFNWYVTYMVFGGKADTDEVKPVLENKRYAEWLYNLALLGMCTEKYVPFWKQRNAN